MNTRTFRFALAFALAAALAASAFAAAPGLTFTVTPVANSGAANEHSPMIDGRYVAYQRYSIFDMVPNSDVYFRDVATGAAAVNVVSSTAAQQNPDISYDLVVYDDSRNGNREIYLYDISSSTETRLTTKAGDQYQPRISNRTVVWYDAATGSLWHRDLMRASATEIPGTAPIDDGDFWDVDGDTVVMTMGTHLYKWTAGSGVEPEDVASIDPWSFESLKTHAGQAVFTIYNPGGRDVSSVSLADGTPTGVDLTVAHNARSADIFDRNVVWQQDAAGNEDIAFAYLGEAGWDGVGSGADDETEPSVFGRRVVFQRPGTLFGQDVLMGTATPEVHRTFGDDRYQTAIKTSKAYFDSAASAVICTGRNFPDALAAAPLAKALEAPLLLVPGDSVPAGLEDELDRLGVAHVWIIGGTDVVSAGVEATLASGRFSTRIAGEDRYETAHDVAFYLYDIVTMSQDLPWTGYAFVARGDAFPDALAVAPVAASVNAPILLTRTGSLPESTADALEFIQTTHPVVVGGSDVVSDAVKNEIQSITVAEHGAVATQRWQGPDRYATAVDVVEHALANNWLDMDTLGVATGRNFPDALGGGAALANYGSPLVLVKTDALPQVVADFMDDHPYQIGRVDIFGGDDVVTFDVLHLLGIHID